jgi:hypothetical protein
VILAEYALQVAMGKEYVANALLPAQWRLLAQVCTNGGRLGLGLSVAKTKTFSALGVAFSGTDVAFHVAKIHFFLQKTSVIVKKSVLLHCQSSMPLMGNRVGDRI